MKINPGWRPLEKSVIRTDAPVGQPLQNKSFSDMMEQRQEQATLEELQHKLKEITLQGDRLSRSMTVRELRMYRQMVKGFLEETVRRGVAVKDTKGWDRRGRTRRYKILEEIDTGLLALADDLLETEEGRIDMLQKLGEIKGMLINLVY